MPDPEFLKPENRSHLRCIERHLRSPSFLFISKTGPDPTPFPHSLSSLHHKREQMMCVTREFECLSVCVLLCENASTSINTSSFFLTEFMFNNCTIIFLCLLSCVVFHKSILVMITTTNTQIHTYLYNGKYFSTFGI